MNNPTHRAAQGPASQPLRRPLAVLLATLAFAGSAAAQIVFYENDGFNGRSYTASQSEPDFRRLGFNDRASSVVVASDRWEVCQDADYGGGCTVLRPGRYASLGAMGLNDRISSVRRLGSGDSVADNRYGPAPVLDGGPVDTRDYRRRKGERVYAANVTAVRAVQATPEQRCWVERGEVRDERGPANVGGAVLGAVLGGVLGHQVGGGVGKGIATAGGAVAGAAVGANVGRNNNGQRAGDVQRCTDVPGTARTAYWDVTYNFRGRNHQVQLTHPPGATIQVNQQGEPRI